MFVRKSKFNELKREVEKLTDDLTRFAINAATVVAAQAEINGVGHDNVTHVHEDVARLGGFFQRYLDFRQQADERFILTFEIVFSYLEKISNLLNLDEENIISDDVKQRMDLFEGIDDLMDGIDNFLKEEGEKNG